MAQLLNSSESTSQGFSPGVYMYFITGSVDYTVGFLVNCWALWLIVSSKAITAEILTFNLILMEAVSAVCFLLTVVESSSRAFSVELLSNFHHAAVVVGRALFPCHVCVDRYLAVVHPVSFIRYKQMKYRGACLALLWLFAIGFGLTNVVLPMNFIAVSICSFAVFVPTLFTEIYCSLSIVRILRKSGPGDKKEVNQQKKRAVKIICLVLVMLVFNNIPFILVPFFSYEPEDFFAAALAFSCLGSSAQALLFLSRTGNLPCKCI